MTATQAHIESTPLWRSREFASAFLPIAFVLGAVIGTYFYLDYRSELNVLRTLEQSRTELGQRISERRIQELARDVRILAESQSINAYLDEPSAATLARASNEFVSLCRHRDVYDQVRYLDSNGQEVLRVNHNNGACTPTPPDQLQNKKRRYYFEDTFKLSRGQVFYSPMDLNVERGAIEQPLKPMIRIGMPVFDNQNRKMGIVLVNYLAEDLRAQLESTLSSQHSHPLLLNRDGYWLMAHRDALEWGFMFDEGPSFAAAHPDAWEVLQGNEAGQASQESGIFSWASVYPVEEGGQSSTGSGLAFGQSTSVLGANDYFWRVGTHVPPEQLAALSASRIRNGLSLFGILLLLALAGSYFLALERRRASTFLGGLKKSESRMRAITAELGEGLILLDSQGRVSAANPKAEKLLGWSEQTLIGEDFHALLYEDDRDGRKPSPLKHAHKTGRLVHIEEDRFRTKSGEFLPVAFTAAPFLFDDEPGGAVLTFEDITERKQAREKLAHLAAHDSLTGLANRGEIERCLDKTLAQAQRHSRSLSVCLLDVDRFKPVNDEYGHQAGDRVLRVIGDRLRHKTRRADCVGRYGGEEFLLVLPDTGLGGARSLGELIRQDIESREMDIGDAGSPLKVTVSVGVAAVHDRSTSADELVKQADEALYQAKGSGRNRVCTYPVSEIKDHDRHPGRN